MQTAYQASNRQRHDLFQPRPYLWGSGSALSGRIIKLLLPVPLKWPPCAVSARMVRCQQAKLLTTIYKSQERKKASVIIPGKGGIRCVFSVPAITIAFPDIYLVTRRPNHAASPRASSAQLDDEMKDSATERRRRKQHPPIVLPSCVHTTRHLGNRNTKTHTKPPKNRLKLYLTLNIYLVVTL